MAKKTQNPQNANSASDQKKNKKKGFEQGTGNNNTTAKDSKMNDRRSQSDDDDMGNKYQERSDRGDQTKITNEDRKITNQDLPRKSKREEYDEVDDDSEVVSQKNDPEIDAPHSDPEPTEKKLPKM